MKLRKILPIVATASVATIATPIVVSCNKTQLITATMDQLDTISDLICIRTKELGFNSGNTYKISFNWSDCATLGVTDERAGWEIRCSDSMNDKRNRFQSANLYLNGNKLVNNVDFEKAGLTIWPLKPLGLDDESELIVEFKLRPTKLQAKKGYVWLAR